MIWISLSISVIALGISAYGLWENHLRPFRILALNSKTISYMGSTEKELLFDFYLSFSNLGKRVGLIKNISILCNSGDNEIKAKVIYECKWASDGSYKKDKDWHPILLRGEETKLAMFVFVSNTEIDNIKDGIYIGSVAVEYQPNLKKEKTKLIEISFSYEINIKTAYSAFENVHFEHPFQLLFHS